MLVLKYSSYDIGTAIDSTCAAAGCLCQHQANSAWRYVLPQFALRGRSNKATTTTYHINTIEITLYDRTHTYSHMTTLCLQILPSV